MVRFDREKILKIAEKDYEKAWIETGKLIKRKGKAFRLRKLGEPNPIFAFIEKARKVFINMGFEEVMLPIIIDEGLVYREYGPECAVILSRVFYLAGLPRPEIGIGKEKVKRIREIVPNFDKVRELQGVFRKYKEGKIEADDLVEAMVTKLSIKQEEVTRILDKVFPEFKELEPIPSKLTLRSHMTAAWFPVLAELQKRKPLPIQLFTIGPKFRREQKLDAMHLYTSHTASLVIMAEELTLEDAKEVTSELLNKLGFRDISFKIKKATSKYYAPRTEFEVFVEHPETKENIEIGDGGFYSPVSAVKFGIEYPVFNVGFGVERLVMIITRERDIRSLSYPYFYKELSISDEKLASLISLDQKPVTNDGKRLIKAVIETAEKYKDKPSPCEFIAYEGIFLGKSVRVKVYETDVGVSLLGPAALNTIYVYRGDVLGIPTTGLRKVKLVEEARSRGVSTGIRYLDSIASLAVAKLEEAIRAGEKKVNVRIRVVKTPSDVNIKISDVAQRYITSKEKKIDVRGPVFIGIKAKIFD